MSSESESDFAFQTLLYVSILVSKGDYKVAERLGLSNDQMSKISELTSYDIHVLSGLTQAKFLSIRFDKEALDKALAIINDKNRNKMKIYELLKQGASYPAMKYLYGLTTADMAAYKKFLNLPTREGRPSVPTENEQNLLWKHITHNDLRINPEELADKLLHVSKTTNIKINIIWMTLHKWNADFQNETKCPC